MPSNPTESHLCRYLEESAARFPGRVAAMDPDGASLTYAELDQRASRIAGFLAARGIQPGDRVGLVLPKNIDALAALFGVMKARAAYVPVDWTGPVNRVRTILTDCSVRAVFLDRRRADLAGAAETMILLGAGSGGETPASGVGPFEWEAALRHEPFQGDAAERHPDDLAYILYTSGSTGVPKGVIATPHFTSTFPSWTSTFPSNTAGAYT
jgi:acyl-CoA synthetase (AMP-forming)/AMP-acid ligase II